MERASLLKGTNVYISGSQEGRRRSLQEIEMILRQIPDLFLSDSEVSPLLLEGKMNMIGKKFGSIIIVNGAKGCEVRPVVIYGSAGARRGTVDALGATFHSSTISEIYFFSDIRNKRFF